MGQWLSCADTCSSSSSASTDTTSSTHTHKHVSIKTPAAGAINRRAALGTESTLVDSTTSQSVTAFPLSTTAASLGSSSSHLTISPPHHRRYFSTTASSAAPFSASTSASPPPQPTHVRSSSASSCSSTTNGLAVLGGHTQSHVDDIIEEVIEPNTPTPTPTPPPPHHTHTHTPAQPARRGPKQHSSVETTDEADELSCDVRAATLQPVTPPQALSPRSVLAFMIVSNGGECEVAGEPGWEAEVEEMDDCCSDDDEYEEEDVYGMTMRDIVASVPATALTYAAPFPSSSSALSYASVPVLSASTSAVAAPSSLHASTTSVSTTSASRPPHLPRRRHQQVCAEQGDDVEACYGESDEDKYSDSEDEWCEEKCDEWCDGGRVIVSTRSIQTSQWTSVASGM